MNNTRRDFSVALTALFAAARANAQSDSPKKAILPSKTYEYSQLPVKVNPTNHNESRQVFDGLTHEGFSIDLHITRLEPGQMPHPPHHHEWEEIIFIQTGNVEANIKGELSRVGPGSVIYFGSNDEHGLKNIGDSPSQYFVLALGRNGRT